MTTQEVADKLVTLCKEGKFEEVYSDLFAPDALSIEPKGAEFETVKGLEAFKKKAEKWHEMIEEVHGMHVSEPIVAENFFACTMSTEVTLKGMKERTNMDEVCVYNVVGGKVVSEQFFYTPTPEFA